MTAALLALLAAPRRVGLSAVARAFAVGSDSLGAVIFVSDGEMLRVGGVHPPASGDAATIRIRLGQGATGKAAEHGHAIRLAADAPGTPAYRVILGLPAEPGGAVARLCLPARGIDGAILGVVSLHRSVGRPYADDDVTTFQPFADLLGMRLQLRGLRDAVDAHHSEREHLIEAAVSAQEDERRRIAFDLHDGVTTALASMSFHLNAADLSLAEGAQAQAREQIVVARSLADLAYEQTRAAITGLHSLVLSDLGLVAAVESIAQTFPSPDVVVEVACDPAENFADLPGHVAATLFRIAQETTANAVRHAQASLVRLELRRREDTVWLTTSDDGVGFDVRAASSGPRHDPDDRPHFGLASIAERCALIGAALRIDSAPGAGTTVTVELPLDEA